MTKDFLRVDENLHDYIIANSLREDERLKRIRDENKNHPCFNMFTTPEQGQLLSFITSLIRPEKILEVGVFLGYSALAMAVASSESCRITALDKDAEWTAQASQYWTDAGVSEKIRLINGLAAQTLPRLIAEGEAQSYDMVFLDADKRNYINYYEDILTLMKKGALLIADNVLWRGAVADESDNSKATVAIRQFNEMIHNDDRVKIVILPVGDGMTLAIKK